MIKENTLVPGLIPTLEKVVYTYQYRYSDSREWKYHEYAFLPEELTPDISPYSLGEKLYREMRCAETRYLEQKRYAYITCSECGHKVLVNRDGWTKCDECKTYFEQFKHVDELFYPRTLLKKYEEEVKNLLSEDDEFLQDIECDDDCSVTFSVSATRYKNKWAMYVWVNENYDDPEDEAYSYNHSHVYWIGEFQPRHWIGECVSTVPNLDRYMKYVNSLNDVQEI
ncbi:hypothetical protein [Paenibacillus sp. NAIST15-1]|uniref:hypothetical protein n=1 Tax=Paenibacillus sp. NAIST15-1 TaxID=1605994 RepID=UPI000868CA72|nr:hypothetical protein [Paenibacillus sp. NAIST15-1]GAV11336.1 hypothetical protein PBN151_1263 [Paenibacillus sp. NAIST15-1]